MLGLLALISAVLAVFIVGLMLYSYLVGGEPLISWKNFFLLGFLQFYALASLWAANLEFASDIYTPNGSGYATLAAAMPIFLAVFLLTHAVAKHWTWPSRFVPKAELPVTTTSVVICGGAFAGLVGLSIPIAGGRYGDALIDFVRTNMASAASALFFYLVLSNWRNPVWWCMFVPAFLLAVVTSVVGSIDRRNFHSVFFALVWVWYYARLRYEKPTKVLTRIAAIAAVTFICLVIYNKGRQALGWSGATFEARAAQLQQLAQNPDFSRKNMVDELLLQDTPLNTVCIIETYPSEREFQPLQGIYYYLVNPIPRLIFENKPRALGIILQEQLQVAANLGCGIIGHGWFEFGWIGVLYYAVGFGIIVAVVDRLMRERGHNPFFSVAFGCSLGNVLGLCRGETSMFFDMITAGFVICLVGFTFMGYLFRPYMIVGKPIDMALPDHDAEADESAEAFAEEYGEHPAGPASGGAPPPALATRDPDEP
ncbi:MAG: hypothetical protein ACT4PL_07725 [Phycisphaerales bacterium]